MVTETLRRSFIAFHLTLGVALLYLSLRTAVQAFVSAGGHSDPHVGAVGVVETIGAVLFLVPRTLRVGGALLLLTLGLVLLVHALSGQFRADLMVYAAGTWFVMVHGSGWTSARRLGDVALGGGITSH
ncbi:MAG TPA: hypothetical protein VGV12_08690 [Gemmatimonadales bacterium]|nr:hypothetical protein [Gemmatimonadales bacterium]